MMFHFLHCWDKCKVTHTWRNKIIIVSFDIDGNSLPSFHNFSWNIILYIQCYLIVVKKFVFDVFILWCVLKWIAICVTENLWCFWISHESELVLHCLLYVRSCNCRNKVNNCLWLGSEVYVMYSKTHWAEISGLSVIVKYKVIDINNSIRNATVIDWTNVMVNVAINMVIGDVLNWKLCNKVRRASVNGREIQPCSTFIVLACEYHAYLWPLVATCRAQDIVCVLSLSQAEVINY